MRKSRVFFVSAALLAFLAFASASYAFITYPKVLVYKGTIKSAKSLIDINDTKNLITNTTNIFYVMNVIDADANHTAINDSNTLIYNTKHKFYKLLSGSSGAIIGDPCGVMLDILSSPGTSGSLTLFFTGKGKLMKYSNDPNAPKAYIPPTLDGTGWIVFYDMFDPAYQYSGPISVSLKLDLAATRKASADANTPLEVVTEQMDKFESKGGWTRWGN
jgi:hypothetical protein